MIPTVFAFLFFSGEKGARGEKGEAGVGDRGEQGPPGPIGNSQCLSDRLHCHQ